MAETAVREEGVLERNADGTLKPFDPVKTCNSCLVRPVAFKMRFHSTGGFTAGRWWTHRSCKECKEKNPHIHWEVA